MKATGLLLFIFLANVHAALGCSCFHKGRVSVEDYNWYDWIFEGTLINTKETKKAQMEVDDYSYLYRRVSVYTVVRAYKGVSMGDTIQVYDAVDNAACGLGHLSEGRNYLVYSIGDKRQYTTDCLRTTRVPSHSMPKDSAMVNKLRKSLSFGRIFDTLNTNFHADTLFLNAHVLKVSKNYSQKFYDENGNISAEEIYKNGVPQGFWKYYENGKVVSKGKYINGKKDSLWIEPFMDQSVYIREYKAGEFTYHETLFFDGRISHKCEPVDNGEKWIEIDYHSNGQPRYIAYASPPQRNSHHKLEKPKWNGLFKTFNKRGIVIESGRFGKGGIIGHWKYYYENGKLRMEGNYIESKQSGVWKIYHSNGRIKAVGTYKNNLKIEGWRFFDERGKEIPPNPKLIEEDEDWFTYSGVKN